MRDVHVRLSYVDDLKTGLPVSYLEFWFAKQDEIDDQARAAFEGPRPPEVDPDYDIVELRRYWAAADCDYFVEHGSRPTERSNSYRSTSTSSR